MTHLLYSLGLALALLLTSPYWLVQALRHGKYRAGFWERLGQVPARLRPARPAVWLHAVSVGEVLAVVGLVEQLRQQMPQHEIYISTTTATGQALAQQRFGAEHVFYFPLDFSFAIRPYLRRLRPELVVVAETEFWPNFLRLADAWGARVAVVNARISDRSLPRYRRAASLMRRVLRHVHLFLAQSDADARRLVEIGADSARVHTAGNLKFDVTAPRMADIASAIRHSAAGAPVLVCGSTVEGEEPHVLDAYTQVLQRHPRTVLLLAVRHPERFDVVAQLVQTTGLPIMRRSQWNGEPLAGTVLLLDTIGELASLYSLATVAFVGGSLVPRGGHNILEPAQFAVPTLVGPHTENFRDIISIFAASDAVRVVRGTAELAEAFIHLLDEPAARDALGRRALGVFQSQQGATGRTVRALQQLRGQR